jgi:phospholipase C
MRSRGVRSDLLYPRSRGSSCSTRQGLPVRPDSDAQFYGDLASGSLPAFSLVRPDYSYYSEEPPEDIEEGDAWLGQVIQAIADSPEWDSTAIFVTYDEGGGFWDHAAPAVKTQYGYGTRTPMVIISPYARHGVFSAQTTNMSVLSFVQHLWGLAPLSSPQAKQNDLMSAFDFHHSPLPAPQVPQAPTDTIAFYDSTYAPGTGSTLTVNLQANTHALTLGPNGSKGWTTVGVGVTPNTLP